jgi:hypothetical protein
MEVLFNADKYENLCRFCQNIYNNENKESKCIVKRNDFELYIHQNNQVILTHTICKRNHEIYLDKKNIIIFNGSLAKYR